MVEQRCRSDPKEDPLLVRFSIGVEEVEESQICCAFINMLISRVQDLKDDLRRALQTVAGL